MKNTLPIRGLLLAPLFALAAPLTAQHAHDHGAPPEAAPTAEAGAADNEPLYQCSMHPNIVSDEPGQCPICAMDLQPVERIEAEGFPGRAPVRLTKQQRQLINLVTAPVVREPVTLRRSVPGVLVHDSSRVFTVAAWAGGRIEKLYVDETETDIETGDPLYRIYSPEIFAAMEDFLIVSRRAEADPQLLRSARFRLEQMGLTAGQIDELAKRAPPPPAIDILSRVTGKVMAKHLKEGQYVREGDKLYEVVDLSELWLIAEIYQSELPYVEKGQRVAMSLPGDSTRTFGGRIDRIEHHIDAATRTARLRIVFDKPDSGGAHQHAHGLLPDMWMRAHLETGLGEQLTIPRSALFDTGQRQYVFVEQEPGLFVPRLVETGPRSGDRLIVRSGLEAGETVAAEGTFLLDSESLLKASASGSEDSTAATGETDSSSDGSSNASAPAGFSPDARAAVDRLWARYFALSEALFDDRGEAARAALTELKGALDALRADALSPAVGRAPWRNWLDETAADLAEIPEADDLKAQRIRFGRMSEALKQLSEDIPELRPEDLVVASCPMWHETDGEWIQRGETVRNPFMGQAMPSCGVIERPLGEAKGGAR
ncbi:MAG: efflux RND transporter periplasmic adaptor subunit [Opitutales bacterium]